MNSFWNKGEKDIIKGLDILGLRGIDQHIETQLVSSITTISIRARYLSLIPWFIGEFFHHHNNNENLDREEMRHDLMQAFDRLELVVILSTYHEKRKNPDLIDTGVIGKDVHEVLVNEFNANGMIDASVLKEKAKRRDYTNPTYGTYYNPCRGFGLLAHSSTAPVALPPNGIKIYDVRKLHVLREEGVLHWLLHGGKLTKEMIEKEAEHFSIANLSSITEEKALLQEFFLIPFDEKDAVTKETYTRFNRTILWVLEHLDEEKKPQQLIRDNFVRCTSSKRDDLEEIDLNWFEFELRRRVHYALELLLKALSKTLDELNGATVERVVETWLEEIAHSDVYQNGYDFYLTSFSEFDRLLDENVDFDSEPIEPCEQGLYAISLLEVCRLQSSQLLNELSKVEQGVDYMRRAFELLVQKTESKVYEALMKILKYCVVEPHLKTTLRKMGQNQQCSLRFFPEGQTLMPTGIDTNAGWSGSRLDNTIRMMSDMGMCEQLANNTYVKNETSDRIIDQLRTVV